ncbi:MAG: glycosyltransferase family 4 protein [Verrucomicrobiaceae bacterium]|nr:glycosyltransferase family 4 protein [Verrucomicrobiaceae bacterium]
MGQSQKVHLWVPGMEETGGIQHYSICLAQALSELLPNASIEVLSKNDCGRRIEIERVTMHEFGHLPKALRTAVFAAKGLAMAAIDKPVALIATHPHFAKAMRWSNRPYLAVAHGVETWGQLNGLLGTALRKAAGVLPVSEFTRQVLLREGSLDPDKVIVVPDTLRESAFAPGPKPDYLLQRHGLKPHQPVLLTVGRLAASEAYKGHDQVIAALPAIRRSFPDVRYVIVGTGDDLARLKACAASHGQEKAVIFAGFIPDHELADYYRLCDAFVMPSTGEGFGIVYLEALASGRPCIVGNQDASPEAIGHGRLGFVVNPRSPDEIVAAVSQFLSRQHDKPWLYEPEILRSEVIKLYGFKAFRSHLASALRQLVPSLELRTEN